MLRGQGLRVFAGWVCALICLTGCGRQSSRPGARLTVSGIGTVSGCTGYGHSYVAGTGLAPDDTFLALVCRRYGLPVVNQGIGGSSIQSRLLATLGTVPPSARTQLSIVMWGINDLGAFGPSLGGYRAALRLLVSRLRTAIGDIHSYRDPAVTFDGSWVDAAGEKVTTRAGAFTWRSPASFAGGDVAFIVTARPGFGARYAFTLDGHRAGTFDTRGLAPAPPAPDVSTPVGYRVAVPAGAHVIRCQIGDLERGANLVGWQVEARRTGLVVLVEQPRLKSYDVYRIIHAPYIPTNRSVLALNRTIAAVAAEFDNHVIVVNADRMIGGRQRYFQADGLHPTATGDRLIAGAIESAIASRVTAASALH